MLKFRNNPSMHKYLQVRGIPYEDKGTHLEVEECHVPQTEKNSWKRLLVIPDEKRRRKSKSSKPYEPRQIIRMPVKEKEPLVRPPAQYSNRNYWN